MDYLYKNVESEVRVCYHCGSERIELFDGLHTKHGRLLYFICVDCGKVVFPPSSMKVMGHETRIL